MVLPKLEVAAQTDFTLLLSCATGRLGLLCYEQYLTSLFLGVYVGWVVVYQSKIPRIMNMQAISATVLFPGSWTGTVAGDIDLLYAVSNV